MNPKISKEPEKLYEERTAYPIFTQSCVRTLNILINAKENGWK